MAFERENAKQEEIDFALTNTKKTHKSVQFQEKNRQKEEPSMKQLKELQRAIEDFKVRADGVSYEAEKQVTCENPQLLEALMEHIVLNWDDLGEKLLEDEIDQL